MRITILLALGVMLAGWGWYDSPKPVITPPPVFLAKCETSDHGLAFIEKEEGYVPFVYKDVGGLPTIGFGHLILPGEKFKQPLLPPDARKLLEKDAGKINASMNRCIKVKLRPNHCDSLGSLAFNIGPGAVCGSTLLKLANQSRHAEVPPQFLRWNKARINGKLTAVTGLTKRRQAEADLYGSVP